MAEWVSLPVRLEELLEVLLEDWKPLGERELVLQLEEQPQEVLKLVLVLELVLVKAHQVYLRDLHILILGYPQFQQAVKQIRKISWSPRSKFQHFGFHRH